MARSPRARVSMTSGQGVSRLSYQKSYALRGEAPSIKSRFSAQDSQRRDNNYGKAGGGKYPGGINISYGDTLEPTDLADVKALGKTTGKTMGRK